MLGLVLGLALAAGGCTQTVVYQGAEAHELHGRSLLFLQPTPIPPLPGHLYQQAVDRVEKALADSPNMGPVVTRSAFLQQVRGRPALREAYRLFSDTLSITGFPDPEIARQLGKAADVQFLATVQLAYLPCSVCQDGDRMWLVGQVLDAHTGKLLYRLSLNEKVDKEALPQESEALVGDYLTQINRAFALRWFRERFRHLKRAGSSS